ncbi:hypothetical protein P0F65_07680 [Sphingomonas sp. I4]
MKAHRLAARATGLLALSLLAAIPAQAQGGRWTPPGARRRCAWTVPMPTSWPRRVPPRSASSSA